MPFLTAENSTSITESALTQCNCFFCGKSHKEVICLAAGPSVFICNECVATCFSAILGNKPKQRLFRIGTKV
ncbi:MAG: hypothetical protein IPG33_12435 [Betaproteobacteria bacterium]|nr:hypothetical protein [Betaproteobacteria bacterium]